MHTRHTHGLQGRQQFCEMQVNVLVPMVIPANKIQVAMEYSDPRPWV